MRALSPAKALRALCSKAPLVHVLTNTVSQNDCANLLLAVGARPIMAEAKEEVQEVTRGCAALVLNTGIPSAEKFDAMLLAGKAANKAGIPVLLDPVGIGASVFRREQIGRLLEQVSFALIRGNRAEIAVLAGAERAFSGVDDIAGQQAEENSHLARQVAQRHGAVVLQSGAQDFITDGAQDFFCGGGHPAVAQVTGAGCMLSALAGAFLAAVPENSLAAGLAAATFWKLCAKRAAARMQSKGLGTGSLRIYLMDEASLLTPELLGECDEDKERAHAALCSDRPSVAGRADPGASG